MTLKCILKLGLNTIGSIEFIDIRSNLHGDYWGQRSKYSKSRLQELKFFEKSCLDFVAEKIGGLSLINFI